MKTKIIGIASIVMMLVIPVCGSPVTTNEDVEFKISACRFFQSSIGFCMDVKARNNGNESVNVTIRFFVNYTYKPDINEIIEHVVPSHGFYGRGLSPPSGIAPVNISIYVTDNPDHYCAREGYVFGLFIILLS